MTNKIYCTECGYPGESKAKFCSACGHPLISGIKATQVLTSKDVENDLNEDDETSSNFNIQKLEVEEDFGGRPCGRRQGGGKLTLGQVASIPKFEGEEQFKRPVQKKYNKKKFLQEFAKEAGFGQTKPESINIGGDPVE